MNTFTTFARLTVAAFIAVAPLAAGITPAGAQGVDAPACSVPNVQASTAYAAIADRPDIANQYHLSGKTLVQVDIDAAGNLIGAEVAKSSGYGVLDRAALDAARASKFSPAVQNCTATPGSYLFEVDFDN